MAYYYALYGSHDWNDNTGWWDPGDLKFAVPGADDVALIQDSTPIFSNGYLNGPLIWLDAIYGITDGLTVNNSVIGGNTEILSNTNNATGTFLALNNVVSYANVFDQQGKLSINIGANSYGANFATMISGGFAQASNIIVNAGNGFWNNIGNMYAFQNGEIDIDSGSATGNYGVLVANQGVLRIGSSATPSIAFQNQGNVTLANNGSLVVNDHFTQNGTVEDDSGNIAVNAGLDGNGMFKLGAGTMSFIAENMAPGTSFNATLSGSSFEFDIDLKNVKVSLSGNDLHVAGTTSAGNAFGGLDIHLSGGSYSASEFVASNTPSHAQIIYHHA